MASGGTIPGAPTEHRGLSYWMERVLKELAQVRTSPDANAVHDLRVALRRCRSLAAVMEEVDPDAAWPEKRRAKSATLDCALPRNLTKMPGRSTSARCGAECASYR